MKKCIVIMFLLFVQGGCLFTVYALSSNSHHESSLLLNFSYSFFLKSPFSPDANADNQFDSLGTALTFRSYANWANFGFYLNTYFSFPGKVVSTKTGGLTNTTEQIDMMLGLIIGPSYRLMLDGGVHLYFALGFHFGFITGSYAVEYPDQISGTFQTDLSGTIAGAGGEFGLKYDASDVIHLSFGVVWTLDFGSTIYFAESSPNRPKPNYAWIGIRPYIGMGITITSDHSWYVNLINEDY
jgi:hypothetical protein